MKHEPTKPAADPTSKEKIIKAGLTHQGKARAIGDEIEVSKSQLAFLRKRGYIADPTAAAAPANAPSKE